MEPRRVILAFFLAYPAMLLAAAVMLLAPVVIVGAIPGALLFGAGIAMNLVTRSMADSICNWREVNEDWVWVPMAILVVLPLGAGTFCLAAVVADPSMGAGFLAYLTMLAGYIFAMVSPKFEFTDLDVLIVKKVIETRIKREMWKVSEAVRRAESVTRRQDP